jgi:hypothetical protein
MRHRLLVLVTLWMLEAKMSIEFYADNFDTIFIGIKLVISF